MQTIALRIEVKNRIKLAENDKAEIQFPDTGCFRKSYQRYLLCLYFMTSEI